jgi:hypothetical protein
VVDLADIPVGLYRDAVRFNAAFLRASGTEQRLSGHH